MKAVAFERLVAAILVAGWFMSTAARAQVRVNPHDEAAHLIDALELSNAQRNAARDHMTFEMARGGTPRTALQRWIETQRSRGILILCRPAATAECVAAR
jgi:hypothetical protein